MKVANQPLRGGGVSLHAAVDLLLYEKNLEVFSLLPGGKISGNEIAKQT